MSPNCSMGTLDASVCTINGEDAGRHGPEQRLENRRHLGDREVHIGSLLKINANQAHTVVRYPKRGTTRNRDLGVPRSFHCGMYTNADRSRIYVKKKLFQSDIRAKQDALMTKRCQRPGVA